MSNIKSSELDYEKAFEYLRGNGFQVLREIGSGSSGKCVLIHSLKYNCDFVCKIVPDNDTDFGTVAYEREVKALGILNHQYIVKMYQHFSLWPFRFMIIEYCEKGSLKTLIKQHLLTMDKIKEITKQLVAAIKECHENGIAHLDIKPENVLIHSHGFIRLCDFGLSEPYRPGQRINKFFGSIPYMSPEVLNKTNYDAFKADVWSFGVTLYQMITGLLPFNFKTLPEMKASFEQGFKPLPSDTPKELTTIIRMALVNDPDKRATIKDISNYIFIEEKNAQFLPALNNKKTTVKSSSFLDMRASSSITPFIRRPRLKGFYSRTPGIPTGISMPAGLNLQALN